MWSLFAAHLSALGLRPDPALDADMEDFPRAYDRPDARFLVAEAPSGVLVGMAGLLEGEIRRVFVDPHWRGQGIAKRLVLGLIESAEGSAHEPALTPTLSRPTGEGAPATAGAGEGDSPRFMAGEQVRKEQGTLHEPAVGRAGCPQPAAPGAPGTARPTPLRAVVARANAASRRLFEACGFVPSGRTPAHPLMQHCEVLERPLRWPRCAPEC